MESIEDCVWNAQRTVSGMYRVLCLEYGVKEANETRKNHGKNNTNVEFCIEHGEL